MPRRNNKQNSNRRNTSASSRRPKGKETTDNHQTTEPGNNAAWYFTDASVMDSFSQLSFQYIKGRGFLTGTVSPANFAVRHMLPHPGSTLEGSSTRSETYSNQTGLINAATRTYNMIAATTGRALSYQPSDIAIMLLAFGEIISVIEYCRRALATRLIVNPRNRAYPSLALQAMGINSTDFEKNYDLYRDRLNYLITTINQVPVPKNIAYFDKCANMYEHIYVDSPSPMAVTFFDVPAWTWVLEEAVSERGSVLRTVGFVDDLPTSEYEDEPFIGYPSGLTYDDTETVNSNAVPTTNNFGDYLDVLKTMITNFVNSSTLNLVYADLLNYSYKASIEFWKFDYVTDTYSILPEVDAYKLIQLHNTQIPAFPMLGSYTDDRYNYVNSSNFIAATCFNDVISDADRNGIFYIPGFRGNINVVSGTAYRSNETDVLVDMPTPNPSVDERVDMTRYLVGYTNDATLAPYSDVTNAQVKAFFDLNDDDIYLTPWITAGDHVCAALVLIDDGNLWYPIPTTYVQENSPSVFQRSQLISEIDYAPIMHVHASTNDGGVTWLPTSSIRTLIGDLDSPTMFPASKLKAVNDMCNLGLFMLR